MANSFISLHAHVVFSTKRRRRWIAPEFEQRIWAYLGGIARENGLKPVAIGGVEDHVHLLLGLPATISISKALQLIKGGSSSWIHETFPELRDFAWQDGYGAFSIGKSQIPVTTVYITNQREHHQTRTFEDGIRAFLRKHDILFDERYLLD